MCLPEEGRSNPVACANQLHNTETSKQSTKHYIQHVQLHHKNPPCASILYDYSYALLRTTIYTHLYSGIIFSKNERFMFTMGGFNPTLQATH
jgi:hypothetical protein